VRLTETLEDDRPEIKNSSQEEDSMRETHQDRKQRRLRQAMRLYSRAFWDLRIPVRALPNTVKN